MNAAGMLFNDPNNPLSGSVKNDATWGNHLGRIQNSIYNGDYGWGNQNSPSAGAEVLIRGSGHQMITNADGSHTNVPFGSDMGINGVGSRRAAQSLEGGYGGLRFGSDAPGFTGSNGTPPGGNGSTGGSGNQGGGYLGGTMGGPGSWAGYWDFSNGRGWPTGQYAYGTNGPAPTTPTQQRQSYGSWPSSPAGAGVVAAGGGAAQATGGNRNPSDAMYGDYSNGW